MKSLNFFHWAVESIESFLMKRLQQVTVNGMVSDWIELKQGILQGTVLEPLLLNLYVNDLSSQISEKANKTQYVDDCFPYCSDSESEIALNRLKENRLQLPHWMKKQAPSEARISKHFKTIRIPWITKTMELRNVMPSAIF